MKNEQIASKGKMNSLDIIFKLTAILLLWIMSIYATLILYNTKVFQDQTVQQAAWVLLLGLLIGLSLLYSIPRYLNNQHFQYIMQLKNNHGFKDLSKEKQKEFIEL
ncbi:MAG: hypothetical protein ACFFD2_26740, partial [Promethearchaeota archaeon]